MIFNINAALLDALVLAIVKKEDTYGYEITRVLKNELDVSESTLYPVLRRLQKDDCLEIYDKEYSGRNRRYYKITDRGRKQLDMYRDEWQNYKATITNIFEGENAFCPDMDQNHESVGALADTLRQSKIWYFWWD